MFKKILKKSTPRIQLNQFLSKVQQPINNLLEIGPGKKNILRFKNINPNSYFSIDINPDSNPNFLVDINYDLSNASELKGYKEYFDCIFCLECMQYIWNPVTAHKNIFSLLKNGGKAYISYHFIYPVHSPSNLDYLRYTKSGILKFSSESGFSDTKIVPRQFERASNEILKVYKKERMQFISNSDTNKHSGYIAILTK